MNSPKRWVEKVEYVVVERDGVARNVQLGDIRPTPTIEQILPRSYTKRQDRRAPDNGDDSDDDDDSSTTSTTATPSFGGPPPLLITMTLSQTRATVGALAENDPMETVVVSLQPPPRPDHNGSGGGRISQTTEHLLIAAGSIGATIIVVMVVLAIYTMRRRGMSFSDVLRQGKNQVTRRGGGSGSKYDWDNKQNIEQRYSLRNDAVYPPPAAAKGSRSGSLSSQTRVQPLARSDSFRNGPSDMSQGTFLLQDPPSRMNSHKRGNSATPSSPILGTQGQRNSESTHNTRSMDDDDEYVIQEQGASRQPPPPTFRQFMSNRPSISQRPGLGGINSRFSWTNSQAPQTPHDPSRDTMNQPLGRDSFMTNRSSVPRFRTINSWVNQQSNRVEEQKLREQYRMTQSSAYSEDTYGDQVPEMPAVPKTYKQTGGLAGKDIKHQRHETTTSIGTAPVFRQHPGTEVRFSTRSTVPSEILDMGRKNSVLR
ncbi:hypothetical protein OPT61_g6000 [Boeremia exigua]|uniref:Uncharacterized protein n=1 Tax=Boeremia exigua TaxID=749465 RepID=A0ACC2I8E2_9PLEO|nr:hypothetical protein OPT61_g6000 [Boeremia exigua]